MFIDLKCSHMKSAKAPVAAKWMGCACRDVELAPSQMTGLTPCFLYTSGVPGGWKRDRPAFFSREDPEIWTEKITNRHPSP